MARSSWEGGPRSSARVRAPTVSTVFDAFGRGDPPLKRKVPTTRLAHSKAGKVTLLNKIADGMRKMGGCCALPLRISRVQFTADAEDHPRQIGDHFTHTLASCWIGQLLFCGRSSGESVFSAATPGEWEKNQTSGSRAALFTTGRRSFLLVRRVFFTDESLPTYLRTFKSV